MKQLERKIARPLVYEPGPSVSEALETYMLSEIKRAFLLPAEPSVVHGAMGFDAWLATPEGRLHMQIMNRYIVTADHIDAKTANRIQRQLQSQNRELRGRPRIYDARLHDLTFQRRVRIYLMDKLVAKALGLDPNEVAVPFDIAPDIRTEPVDTYDALARFEEWSGTALPRQAWLHYTLDERKRYAEEDLTLGREKDGGVLFSVFKQLRAPAVRDVTITNKRVA